MVGRSIIKKLLKSNERSVEMKNLHKIGLAAVSSLIVVIAIGDCETFVSKSQQGNNSGVVQCEARPCRLSLKFPVLMVRQRIPGKCTDCCTFFPMGVVVSEGQSPLRISFSDDTPNVSGATIRNSLWTAAIVAVLKKEYALQGVRISLDFKRGVDGPSAGAAMCLGLMSDSVAGGVYWHGGRLCKIPPLNTSNLIERKNKNETIEHLANNGCHCYVAKFQA